MLRLLALLLIPAMLAAQVNVQFSPLSMKFSRKIGGDLTEAGVWSVRVCSSVDRRIVVDSTRVYMAAPQLKLIGPHEASMFFGLKQRKKRGVLVAEILANAGRAGASLIAAGVIQADGRIGAAAVIGAEIAALVGVSLIKGEGQVKLDPERVLKGPLVLEAHGCADGLVLAPLLPRQRVHVYDVTLEIH